MSEMVTITGDDFGTSLELLDNVIARYLERWKEANAAARAKIASMPEDDLVSTAEELIKDDPMTPEPDWETFAMLFTGLDPDNPFTHSNGELITMSAGSTDLLRFGAAWVDFSEASTGYLFGGSLFGPGDSAPRFPCGAGPVATTLCGSEPFPAGTATVIASTFAADVPASDTVYYYQYGFVFDADADPTNNYQASAAYPKDLFDNTDRWWEVLHDPTTDTWSLKATLARDGAFTVQPTAARAIINGKSIVLVIPASELESAAPPFRNTAFKHTGNFGVPPPHDFNGDVFPLVGDPLAMRSSPPFTAADGM